MDEKEIYEVLGVDPPPQEETGGGDGSAPQEGHETKGDSSAQEPEGTGENPDSPGEEPSGAGEARPQGSGKAAQAAGGEGDAQEAEEGPSSAGADPTEGTGQDVKQTAEERSAQILAEAKRLADQQTARAVEEERARNKAQWDAFFASAGLKNNLEGGKPITSLEEFQQWKIRYDRMKLEQDLKDGKLTPEALEAMIRSAMGRAGEARPQGSERAAQAFSTGAPPQSSAEAGQNAAENGRNTSGRSPSVTKEQIDQELAEIHRMDGSVNGLEDILKMETGGAFQEAVRRGHSFLDAFKLANFDRLQSRAQNEAAQRAAQAARNSVRSKEHLRSSDSKGGGSVSVPGDVLEMYRMMMPNATEAEITAHYNRMLKEMKK